MFRLPFRTVCIAVLFSLFAVTAQAKICLYRDADGHTTYSNVTDSPPKDAQKIRCFEDAKPPRSEPAPAASPAARNSGSSTFPKVDGNTQRKRDDERRRILAQELESEQQRLDMAKQALAAQESVRSGDESNYQRALDRIQPFREAVANHERNIEAIQRELANMR